jgi:CubicO group peptidase (beta-lactamase class C family)
MRSLTLFKIHRWVTIVTVALMCTLAISPVSALQTTNVDLTAFPQIDNYISSEMADLHIPGISIAIVQGNQIVHLKSFGIADPSRHLLTPQTPMLIGSLTKSFTALAIMQLVDAGKIDLDTPAQHYLPWFFILPPPETDHLDIDQNPDSNASSRITIRHLLNQTSGISRSTGEKMIADWDSSDSAIEHYVRALGAERMHHPAGAGFEYSNANYITLGMIVQAVSGLSYETYIQEHIFKPLEMHNSCTSQLEAQQHGMSAGYRQWFGFPVLAGDLPYPRGLVSAGYLISSAEDLAHYIIAQMNAGQYKDVSIVSSQAIETLHAPAVPVAPEGYHRQPSGYYGMGWYVMEMNNIPVLVHDGDTPNFHADMIFIPSREWGIVLLVNTNTVLLGDGIRNLSAGVANILMGQKPPRAEPDMKTFSLYIFFIGFLGFEFFKLGRFIFSLRRQNQRNKFVSASWFKQIVLPVLIGLIVVLWMFIIMPLMFKVPWQVMIRNQPDLAWVVLLGGLLALINGILQSMQNAWKISKTSLSQI